MAKMTVLQMAKDSMAKFQRPDWVTITVCHQVRDLLAYCDVTPL
jgi:hypothetical protein